MGRSKKYQAPKWLTPKLLHFLIEKGKSNKARQDYLANAKRYRNWYRGDLFLAPGKFDDKTIPEENATSRKNVIGETVDAISALFLKNSPVVRRIPFRPEWAKLSDDIDNMFLWQWKSSFGQQVTRSILEDAEITGLSGMKIFWDNRKGWRRQNGGVTMKSIPMGNIIVDPMASNDHRAYDASYIIEVARRYPEELVALFGADAEKALGWRSSTRGRPSTKKPVGWQMLGMTNEELTRRVDGDNTFTKFYPPLAANLDSGDKGKIPVYECWLFPDLLFGRDLAAADDVGEHFRFGLVAVMVNDQIIRVRPNPFASMQKVRVSNQFQQIGTAANWLGHGTHPYVFMHWRPVADQEGNRKFYNTMSMIEWMVSMQFSVNALRRNMAIILRTLANPMIAYNQDALATPANKIKAIPGQMLAIRGKYRMDEAFKVIQGSQLPPQVQQMIYEDIQGIKTAGGLLPGAVGLFPAPGGGTSHTQPETIGTLQESAFAVLWKYVQRVEAALEDVSHRYDGLMQQFFDEGHYEASSKNGQVTGVDWTGDHKIAQFRRIVVAGATTPVYDMMREQREGGVKELTDAALTSNDARIMRSTLIYLNHLNFPWTMDYAQLLEEELSTLQQRQQSLSQVGLQQMLQGGGQPPAEAMQVGAQQPGAGTDDITQLAASMGVSPEQLMVAATGRS